MPKGKFTYYLCPLGTDYTDIKLYEAKNRLFSSINRTLGEGIAQLLSLLSGSGSS